MDDETLDRNYRRHFAGGGPSRINARPLANVSFSRWRGSLGTCLRTNTSGRVPRIWVAERVWLPQANWYVFLVFPRLVICVILLHLIQYILLLVENAFRATRSLLFKRSNSIPLGTWAQVRASFSRDSCSHKCWACSDVKSSLSEDSVELDSKNESFLSNSDSESDKNGFIFNGAGGDRSGKSA